MEIKQAYGARNVLFEDGNTENIIEVLLFANEKSKEGTEMFSKRFTPDLLGYQRLYHFVKSNIKYKEDPFGKQWIKTPQRLWLDKIGDCKSFTIFICSVLQNLNVPYKIRFVAYSGNKRFTHVYPLAYCKKSNRWIAMDAVWKRFDDEKKYSSKRDYNYNMAKIEYLSGTNSVNAILSDIEDFDITNATDKEYQMHLVRENLVIKYQNSGNENFLIMAESISDKLNSISGIGGKMAIDLPNIGRTRRRTRSKTTKNKRGIIQAALNMVFKKLIPKAAFYFLYALLNNDEKLPLAVQRKREKQTKLMNWVLRKTKMSKSTFLKIAQNGIEAKYKMKPKALLSHLASGKQIAGIGDFVTIAVKVINVIKQIVKVLSKVFGGNDKVEASKDDVPSEEDFKGTQRERKEYKEVVKEEVNNSADMDVKVQEEKKDVEEDNKGSGKEEKSNNNMMIALGLGLLLFGNKI